MWFCLAFYNICDMQWILRYAICEYSFDWRVTVSNTFLGTRPNASRSVCWCMYVCNTCILIESLKQIVSSARIQTPTSQPFFSGLCCCTHGQAPLPFWKV